VKKIIQNNLEPSFINSYDFGNLLLLNAQRKSYGIA